MASPPTSDSGSSTTEAKGRLQAQPSGSEERPWYRFWSTGGKRLQGTPTEWARALLEVRPREGPLQEAPWTDLRLLRNGEALPLRREQVAGQVRTVAPWPRSGPGRYELKLLGSEAEREVEISIWPSKISRKEFRDLIEGLESKLPTQVAFALKQAGGLAGIELNHQEGPTLEQELVRLRRAVHGTENRPGLAAVLRGLTGRPHRVLTSEERWVRRGRARRPPGDRLGQAFARPDNVEDAGRAETGQLKEVPDARSRHTADVYENRLLQQFARQVRLRLRRIEPALRERSEELAGQASKLQDTLRGARRQANFLEEVSDLKRPPTRASQTLQKRTLYRAALKGYLAFQREIGVNLNAPELEAPLDNLPFLYQLWCTLQLIRILLEEAGQRGFRARRSSLFQRQGGLLELHLGGQAAELVHPETGVEIKVFTERSYGRGTGVGLRSISYAQRPDVSIEVTYPSGKLAVYLFDPKYKLDAEREGPGESQSENVLSGGTGSSGESSSGEPRKPDLDKMHAYRDAIRGQDGRRVVEYAAILYPGRTRKFSEGMEAIGVRPGRTEKLSRALRQILECVMQQKEA